MKNINNKLQDADYNYEQLVQRPVRARRMRISPYKIFRLLLILGLIVSAIYMGYKWYDNNYNNTEPSNSEVIQKISSKMLLPNTDPSMMVKVKNAAELKSVDKFYKDVADNDYVIIYSDLAIIYRPSTDKLVQVMTITGGSGK